MTKPLKQCPVCAKLKPLVAFDDDPNLPGGKVDLCRDCISEMLTTSLRAKSLEVSARNDEALRTGLEAELHAAAPMEAGGDYCPDISTLTGEIVNLFGGARGLARSWMTTYLATDPSSHSRVKMHSELRQMVERTTDEGKAKTLESMSDEELAKHREKLMQQLVMNLATTQRKNVIEVPSVPVQKPRLEEQEVTMEFGGHE